ncbi:MAG: class I SAM-dependent methyltransferase [Phycisphaerales bacterium]|nr:class I SAM-dependent methyltransferase [Phycisphaerales bacterium]
MSSLSRFIRGTSLWRRYQRYLKKHSRDSKDAFTARYEYEVSRPEGRKETVCGIGSTMEQTRVARETVARVVREYGIKSMLDAPCGDLNWMKHVPLDGVRYTGGDVVQQMVDENRAKFAGTGREFVLMNIIEDVPEAADLILCRDCLVHLPGADVKRALANFSASGSKYLLATTFPATSQNTDLRFPGEWRAINLQAAPFLLPPPLLLVDEECPDDNGHSKSLGLWKLPL